jgi:hypothetical protein
MDELVEEIGKLLQRCRFSSESTVSDEEREQNRNLIMGIFEIYVTLSEREDGKNAMFWTPGIRR